MAKKEMSIVERMDHLRKLVEAEKTGDNDPRYISDIETTLERLAHTQPMPDYVRVN